MWRKIMKHSNNLHNLRLGNNLSQSEISKHLDISQGLYCRMERGSVDPTKYLAKLSELFKVKTNEIYSGEKTINEVIYAQIPVNLPVYGMPTLDGKKINISNKFASTTERPDYLKDSPSAYSCFVVGNEMQPRFNHGELIYIDPIKKISNESEILISTFEDDQEIATLQCLISEGDDHYLCATYQSEEHIKILKKDVGRVHAVVGLRQIY